MRCLAYGKYSEWGPSETINKYKVGNILNWNWDQDLKKINNSRIIEQIIDNRNHINEEIRKMFEKIINRNLILISIE